MGARGANTAQTGVNALGGGAYLNNYATSFGTDASGGDYAWNNTNDAYYHQDPMGSPGLFAYGISYGVQSCTDGVSNTVAYAEWLVGDGKGALAASTAATPRASMVPRSPACRTSRRTRSLPSRPCSNA